MKLKNRLDYRQRRHWRLRKKVSGTAERPRMSVCISRSHLYIQFIDDIAGTTLVSWSTVQDEAVSGKNNVATAQAVGKKAAELALQKGIKEVVFDRGGNAYQGRVKAIAEAARGAGMKL